jgi:hypothetical protein
MLKKLAFSFVFLLLAGCGQAVDAGPTAAEVAAAEPLDRQEYVVNLGHAVCSAVRWANADGVLNDEAKLAYYLEKGVRDYVVGAGIDEAAWLRSKQEHFTPEEHEKLLKLHFTWCVTGLSEME